LQGPCQKHYKDHSIPIAEFSLSIAGPGFKNPMPLLLPAPSYKPATELLDMLSHSSSSTKEDPTGDHLATKIVARTKWQQTPNGGSSKTSSLLDNFSSELIHKYVTNAGTTTTTTTIYILTGPENQHLDWFLFHQKLAPYIPKSAKLASSGLLQGGTLNPQMTINGEPQMKKPPRRLPFRMTVSFY
jgi:hypothetical protein